MVSFFHVLIYKLPLENMEDGVSEALKGSTTETNTEGSRLPCVFQFCFLCVLIAKISVTSPIVVNMPTREKLVCDTKDSLV